MRRERCLGSGGQKGSNPQATKTCVHRIESERERKRGCSPKRPGAQGRGLERLGRLGELDLGLRARCLSPHPGGEKPLRAAERCRVSNLACLLGPRRSKRAKDRQGLRKAAVRTGAGEVGIAAGETPWGSFVKSRRKCLRQRDLPTHLARRPFSADRSGTGAVRGRDHRSLAGFLASTSGNSESPAG